MKKIKECLLFAILANVLPLNAQNEKPKSACPLVKMEAERLPDLNIPRTIHNTFRVGDEIVVVGGHASGFVLTKTAEYLRDGRWHVVPTVYVHGGGFSLPLRSGDVLVGGGFEKDLGIGQTYTIERYIPERHEFQGFSALRRRRAYASAVELDSGRVLVGGNWYHDDGLELFDGDKNFTFLRDVKPQRAFPYLFRTSADDVMILGNQGIKGQSLDYPVAAERLRGEPVDLPLLAEWQPLRLMQEHRAADSFVGDEAAGHYAYLMAVENRDSMLAIARVEGTDIALLPTVCPVPTRSPWGRICYFTTVIADREAQRGYVVGRDDDLRLYVLAVDYAQSPAPLTLYHTEPLGEIGWTTPVLTADGNLLLASGAFTDNFHPTPAVWLLRLHPAKGGAGHRSWGWIVRLLAVLGVAVAVWLHRRRNLKLPPPTARC